MGRDRSPAWQARDLPDRGLSPDPWDQHQRATLGSRHPQVSPRCRLLQPDLDPVLLEGDPLHKPAHQLPPARSLVPVQGLQFGQDPLLEVWRAHPSDGSGLLLASLDERL